MSLPGAEPGAPQDVRVEGSAGTAVSALERGLDYGEGLFETVACLEGRPRFLGLHLERLAEGCRRFGIAADLEAVRSEVQPLAAAAPRAIVKVLITRGAAQARGYALSGLERPTRIVLRYGWTSDEQSTAHSGVRVRIGELRLGENPALAGLKHCNRLEQVLARREWSDRAIAEALLFSSSGALISGTAANVFLVRGGRLFTPRLDRCGVAGVMRRVVLALAAHSGIAAEERRVEREDLEAAEELFLTNALIGIRPVRELEGRSLPPGELTRRLSDRLAPWLEPGARLPGELAGV